MKYFFIFTFVLIQLQIANAALVDSKGNPILSGSGEKIDVRRYGDFSSVNHLKQQIIVQTKKIVKTAYNDHPIKIFGKIKNALFSSRLVVNFPEDDPWMEAKYCEGNTLAWVHKGRRNIIHICQLGINSTKNDYLAFSQIIVHELVHVVGYDNECFATKVEHAVMLASGYGIRFKNGYVKSCGL